MYIDDSIMQLDKPATAGSKILENFISPIEATVITLLNERDHTYQQVRLGEFGLCAPDTNSFAKLEIDDGQELLCNDIFGHVRTHAVKQGLYVFRPSYGTVSRFGLIPVACSMDQISIICKAPEHGYRIFGAVAGHDDKDGAMFPQKEYLSPKSVQKELKWAAFFNDGSKDGPEAEAFLQNKGLAAYKTLTNDCLAVGRQVQQVLAYAEITGNLSRYDGIKFGYRTQNYHGLEDLYTKTRTEGFGPEVKLALLMGCLVLSQDYYEKYYEKAMKIRRLIKNALCFDGYDVLALPVSSPLAVLAGLPSLSFGGVQLVANVKQENVLQTAWEALQ